MERTYFRNNKVIKSPAHEEDNPKKGDYQLFTIPLVHVTDWFAYRNGNWYRIHYDQIPNEIKILLLIGGA